MLGFLKGKIEKTPPTAQVLSFEQGGLELRLAKPLEEGSHDVILKLENGTTFPARVLIDSYLQAKDLHWASLENSPEAEQKLYEAFPAAKAEAEAELAALNWEEKRGEQRLTRAMGIMSPDVTGFKALTWDLSYTGLRMQLNQEFAVGRVVKMKLDLDDHRIPPLDILGEVLWIGTVPKPKPSEAGTAGPHRGAFWAGMKLVQVPEKTDAIIRKFLDTAFSHEDGVLSRDYAAD